MKDCLSTPVHDYYHRTHCGGGGGVPRPPGWGAGWNKGGGWPDTGVRGLEAIGGGCGSQLCANRWVLTAHLRYLCAVYGVGKSLPLCPGSRGDEHEARKSDLLHHHTHPFPLNFCAAPRASARLVWHPPLEQPATGPTLATGPCAQVGQLAKSSCLLFPVKR
jgi:hypothetical protein